MAACMLLLIGDSLICIYLFFLHALPCLAPSYLCDLSDRLGRVRHLTVLFGIIFDLQHMHLENDILTALTDLHFYTFCICLAVVFGTL